MSKAIDIRDIKKAKSEPVKKTNTGTEGPASGDGSPRETGSSPPRETGSSIWAFLNKDIRIFGNSIPDKLKESFYLELSTLLGAGMDIRTSLELIRDEQTKIKYREMFGTILEKIVNGSTFSGAMKNSRQFTAYEYYSVQIGEETGKLILVLNELAVYYKKKLNQKRQITGALTYPILVLVVAFSAVSFMMAYVVPMFASILKRFGGQLPLITRLVLSASDFLKKFSPALFVFTIGVIAFILSQRKKLFFRNISSRILLRIPVVGGITQKIYLSRFANTMSLLIGSKIPMLQSIQLVKQMVRFYPIERSLADVEEKVMSGVPLHKSLSYHAVYTKKMISLIKVGEEVNQLDVFFRKISEQYSTEVEYQTNILSKFMEPLIIVVLGLVVGIILIAMYLPLFKLGQAV